MNEFGEWLLNELKTRELGVNQLAEYSGVSGAAISNIINGHRKASPQTVIKLATWLKYDSDELLTLAGHRPLANPEKSWERVEDPELRTWLTAENLNALPEIIRRAITALIKLGLEEDRNQALTAIENKNFGSEDDNILTEEPPSQDPKTAVN